jgi:hydroxyacylglutathione hydrolase
MFIEKIKSAGLSHLSYLIGSGGSAAVVDPRRDCDIYLEMAAARGCRITHIFETHRNEDLLSGAAVLAKQSGATVYHGPNAAGEVAYAQTVREGETFDIGALSLRVLETPGHTDDSVSYALVDTQSGSDTVAVFTGDALFVGDVGRTDFYPDRAREVAGLLFDSLRKLQALGDHVVIYPAHGAGSVCGSGMADREVSTIGYERRNNSRFAMTDRDRFIDAKLAEHHDQPPYFRHMETGNLAGAGPVRTPLGPAPLTAAAFKDLRESVQLVDVRSAAAFMGAHLPDSIALPTDLISAFAGWLLEPDDDIALIADDAGEAELAARHLARIGIDNIRGYLAPSLVAWAATGEAFATLPVADAATVRERLEKQTDWTLLDVRGEPEVEQARISGARHLFIGELPRELESLDRSRSHTVMCGSGARATIAASVLMRAGFTDVDLFLGSMGAWRQTGFDIESAD